MPFPSAAEEQVHNRHSGSSLCCGRCSCCSPAALSVAQPPQCCGRKVPLSGEKARTEAFLRGSRYLSAQDKQEKQGMQYQAGWAGALLPSTNLKGAGKRQ